MENNHIICIDLKTKQLSYICDNENLDSLRRVNNLLKSDYLNYLATEFLNVIKVKSILDDKEKEYLSAVIRPFKKRIVNIIKDDKYGDAYIKIIMESYNSHGVDCIYLPDFKSDTMYKGMEADKEYSLEDLRL